MTMKKSEVPLRISRWAMMLQDFDYEIEHRSGSKMRHVDALSRVSCLLIEESLRHRLKEAQLNDGHIKALRKILKLTNMRTTMFTMIFYSRILRRNYHVGPMTATKKQYNYILVVVDAFSKFVWLYPTKDTGTDAVLDRLQKQSAVFGNPRRIITDRGAAFTSRAFEQYCEEEGIQHLLITTGFQEEMGR
ncbi:hypothetical protein EVAR_91281_1 [Eumeta japonica]|uniref:Integrase catalytic domain-containing protein n=1 Tax=Eumeta variegata TaxID=151549 RepID=A0A4C1TIP1_EUMVA|nr:hypothetical protein EVAR_91281_1 [Eumeta japonica]